MKKKYPVVFIVNLLAIMGLLLSYTANTVNPNLFFLPAFFGLSYPLLLILNLFFIIFWLRNNRKKMLFSLFTILIGWGNVAKTIQLFNKTVESIDNNSLKVLSYNVRSFNEYKWIKPTNTTNHSLDFIQQSEADIICIQEFSWGRKGDLSVESISEKLNNMPYQYISKSKYKDAIFSRYPIINTGSVSFHKDALASGIYTDIAVYDDTIRVFNIHLESTRLHENDYNIFKHNKTGKEPLIKTVKVVSAKLKNAYKKRAFQAELIKRDIAHSPHPVIICGDFNDTPISYVYETISNELKDTFVEKGKGLGITFNGKFPFFRIDYILHDRKMETLDFQIKKVKYSDHYPIIGHIKIP